MQFQAKFNTVAEKNIDPTPGPIFKTPGPTLKGPAQAKPKTLGMSGDGV